MPYVKASPWGIFLPNCRFTACSLRSKVVRGSYLYDKEILNKQTIKILPLCAFPSGRLRLFRYAGIILAFPLGKVASLCEPIEVNLKFCL